MSVWAVVPARMASRRLPGKAVADVAGVPLVVRVVRAAEQSSVDRVLVATDDERVARVCHLHRIEVVQTGAHPCGTHRVQAAIQCLGTSPERVVNVQGDQPLLDPSHVDAAVELLERFPVATVAVHSDVAGPPRRVKVVVSSGGRALYFSRAPIPYGGPYRHHVGIYAFRGPALAQCVAAPRDGLAEREDLEQLAWLEAGIPVGVVDVESAAVAVDDEGDLERVRARCVG